MSDSFASGRGICAAFLVLALQTSPEDLARDAASPDPATRLAAVRAIAERGHTEAEPLLIAVLEDEDWEVAVVAAAELGELGSKAAFEPLLGLSLEAPVRGLRRVAGEALGRVDGPGAYAKLVKKLSGDSAANACEAIAALAPSVDGKVKTGELEKLARNRRAEARSEAARAWVRVAGSARSTVAAALLEDEDVALRAAAIEAAGESGDGAVLEVLLRQYDSPALADFLARRVHAALRAIVLARPEAGATLFAALGSAKPGAPVRIHAARLLGVLGQELAGRRAIEPERSLAGLAGFLADPDAAVRAAAAAACERIASEGALDAAAALAADADARVRRIAIGVVGRARGAREARTRALLLARMLQDSDPRVRETAATFLGLRGLPEVVPSLIAALEDPDWRVLTAASVSLGKTEDERGAAPLMALHAGADDWRRRASAVAGLTRLRAKAAVPTLIAALEDPEALVARTAWEFLCEIAHERLEPEPSVWTRWWAEKGERIKLSIPEEIIERRKALGYAGRSARELFAGTYVGIDVLVLQSRGDHIESVLESLGIVHRRTNSGSILADGLHPQGVFVSNCEGDVTAEERERLAWFVRAGGALFGSCWALEGTIQELEPGLVRKLETRGEVSGDFEAGAAIGGSRYLEGVVAPDVRPLYHLEGAHLIEVLDPEEVEVLIDSPACAAEFGGANLAAWFRLGHGVVLDSANHFEGQGFLSASLRDPEERKAFAIDHLGLTYPELREQRAEKFWNKTTDAAERVKDLSVFRLITNFVWLKRLEEDLP